MAEFAAGVWTGMCMTLVVVMFLYTFFTERDDDDAT